jgi:hypothetical protein
MNMGNAATKDSGSISSSTETKIPSHNNQLQTVGNTDGTAVSSATNSAATNSAATNSVTYGSTSSSAFPQELSNIVNENILTIDATISNNEDLIEGLRERLISHEQAVEQGIVYSGHEEFIPNYINGEIYRLTNEITELKKKRLEEQQRLKDQGPDILDKATLNDINQILNLSLAPDDVVSENAESSSASNSVSNLVAETQKESFIQGSTNLSVNGQVTENSSNSSESNSAPEIQEEPLIQDYSNLHVISPVTKTSCYSEDLAKLFNFYLDPENINKITDNIFNSINSIFENLIHQAKTHLKNPEPPQNNDINKTISPEKINIQNEITQKFKKIKNSGKNRLLIEFINKKIPKNEQEIYKLTINRRILILNYLYDIAQYDISKYSIRKSGKIKIICKTNISQEYFKKIILPFIKEIYSNIQVSYFKTYLIVLEKNNIKPIFYDLKIEQTNNENKPEKIVCTIKLTTLSMILWVLPEIQHDFGNTIFIDNIKALIKAKNKNTNSINDYDYLLLKILDTTISPESATKMFLELCNFYKIPFLNYSENKDKVIYDLDNDIPENKWSSQLPKFLINPESYVINTSDINDHSKSQFAQLDRLQISQFHPIIDYDSGSGPTHDERTDVILHAPVEALDYTFDLKYGDLNILMFNKKTLESEYNLQLYRIGKNGTNLKNSVTLSSSIHYIASITTNLVNNLYSKIHQNALPYVMPSLSMAKLCGDVQYFIASLVNAANINNPKAIFMDSSKDYSAIFHVLGLKNCTYTINGIETIDLNKKNIMGNLVSIRNRGTNFVPKSQRMIDIITLLFVILNYDNLFTSLNIKNLEDGEVTRLISTESLKKPKTISSINYYESIKDFFYEIKNCIEQQFEKPNISLLINQLNTKMWKNLCDCIKDNVANLTNLINITIDNLNLNEYQEKVVNFNYDYVDYWIAEKIYDHIISQSGASSSGNGNGTGVQSMETVNPGGGSKKNKTIKHKRNRKNKTNRNKRNRRNRRNRTIRKKRKRKNKTIKYI